MTAKAKYARQRAIIKALRETMGSYGKLRMHMKEVNLRNDTKLAHAALDILCDIDSSSVPSQSP